MAFLNFFSCLPVHKPVPQWLMTAALVAGLGIHAGAYAQGDALEEASLMSDLAPRSLLLDIDQVGNRLVAVGERGHIITSDDQGKSWSQAHVPVRVTLTASFFVNDLKGWAIGHDGVVLTTDDGGVSWHKQLDGYQANQLLLKHAEVLLAEAEQAVENADGEASPALELDLETAEYRLHDTEVFFNEGASRPFLGIWFKNEYEGYIVGAFGMFLHTQDGGNSWQPVAERLHNPDGFHLNAIHYIDGDLFVVAEAGGIYRSEDDGQSWTSLDSPYDGSFFGITTNAQGLIVVYGLRGHAFFSMDRGDSWHPIETDTDKTILGGARLNNGQILLIGYGGSMMVIDNAGTVVSDQHTPNRLPIMAAADLTSEHVVTVGVGGVGIQPLQHIAEGVER